MKDKFLSMFFVIFSLILMISCAVEGKETNSVFPSLISSAINQYLDNLKRSSKSDSLIGAETRGGGHGGGYGGGGHGHGYGAITLDPVSIISLLALGAFLINNILQLLRANQPAAPAAPAVPPGRRKRALDEVNLPQGIISGFAFKQNDNNNKPLKENGEEKEPSFSKFFENVGSLYYLQPKKRNICIKKVVCKYVNAQSAREERQGTMKTRIFDFMLSAITRLVAPELNSESLREDTCGKFNKLCSDSLLHDAKVSVENKVYAEMSSLISTLAVKQLVG